MAVVVLALCTPAFAQPANAADGPSGSLQRGSEFVYDRRGSDVPAAGEVHVVNGQIRSINNASGHYRPSGSSAQSAAENAFNAVDLDVAPGAYH